MMIKIAAKALWCCSPMIDAERSRNVPAPLQIAVVARRAIIDLDRTCEDGWGCGNGTIEADASRTVGRGCFTPAQRCGGTSFGWLNENGRKQPNFLIDWRRGRDSNPRYP